MSTDYIAPSGSIGLQYDVARTATLGLALQAPSRVSATGTFATRLPRSAFFEGARVVGSESELSFTLPAAIRFGVELRPTPAWRIGAEWRGHQRMLGAGYSYETAAAPTGYVSVLTVDSAKHLLGIGGGYEAGGWQIGASLGILADVQVSLAEARVPQPTPIWDQPGEVMVNAGSYRSRYLLAGLRFARAL